MMFRLTAKSLLNRKFTSSLTVLTLALSISLYLMVGRIKTASQQSFMNTVSKVDLIVGAKGGSLELLLYSVFHMGSATNNINYKAYEKYASHPQVEALIPLSLGDSHQGHRVVGTNENFFKHYHYQGDKSLSFPQGRMFQRPLEVVLGSEVASKLRYQLGQKIILSHGVDDSGLVTHDKFQFEIVGILAPTHTPVDRSVYVPLLGLEAIHADWQEGYEKHVDVDMNKLQVSTLTAFMVIAKNRIATLFLRQGIVTDSQFSLQAIIPGIELSNMWQALSYLEKTLAGISALVIVIGFLTMIIVLFHSLEERRREMAIYRTLGASPGLILGLLIMESTLLSFLGTVAGVLITNLMCFILRPLIYAQLGLYLDIPALNTEELIFLGTFVGLGFVIGLIPGLKAYRNSLRDGLMVKL